jgi:hypothetical protein
MADKKSDINPETLLLFVLSVPISTTINAVCLMLNWNWFAPAIGMTHIDLFEAMGLGLIVHSTSRYPTRQEEETALSTKILHMLGSAIARLIVLGGIGYVVHSIMAANVR